jgi:outer membrane protein insertion porin family
MPARWVLIALLCPALLLGAEKKPVEFDISGYGILGNRQLKRLVRTMSEEELKNEFVDANFIENSAVLLIARLHDDGFLKPTIQARITLVDGSKTNVAWREVIEPPLPRPLHARQVRFRVRKGVQYYFDQITFTGVEILADKRARSYFVETGALLPLKSSRTFTPNRLKRGIVSITEVLERQGYEQAKVTASHVNYDHGSGAVRVQVEAEQGPKSVARSVRVETYVSQTNFPAQTEILHPSRPYSRLWAQDTIQQFKATNYHRGYPDTAAELTVTNRVPDADRVYLDLLAGIHTGPQIKVGRVSFIGHEKTRGRVLNSRVPIESGDLLDPTEVEHGRARLARLGIFDSIHVRYDVVDEHTRSVTYDLKEGKSLIFNLLFGYGSYELLRGGFEVEQRNVFGLAHNARLRAIQSFKSTRGDFLYTMPQLLGEDIDVFFNAFALRREEISFLREEYGGGVGAIKRFEPISSDLSVRYNYQILKAAETEGIFTSEGLQNPNVGAFITDFRHDQRDSPVYPRRGYKIFSNFELASEYVGGEANYQRVELASSYHAALGGGRYLSLGLSHGFVGTVNDPREDLPFNRRFFPGGEYSIRGYQEGEASPRDAQGELVGAETYLLGSIEFEQALTPFWSVVVFSDSITFARELRAYPGDEALFSVGGGIRWKTIVGPVRLEYGHNLNPREDDPTGTLHFSLGFPF